MSRLFTVAASLADILGHFAAKMPVPVTMPGETVEGDRGLIVLESGEHRFLKSLAWGFPRRTREMADRGDEPGRIGLVADLTNPMWDTMVVEPRYRCLIPITQFANPKGEAGEKTRSWFSVRDVPLLAWAGFCRNTLEFGPVFAGMTMTANDLVMPYNDRMSALLFPGEYDRWLCGTIQDVIAVQFHEPIAAERMAITHTDDLWRSGKRPVEFTGQQSLL